MKDEEIRVNKPAIDIKSWKAGAKTYEGSEEKSLKIGSVNFNFYRYNLKYLRKYIIYIIILIYVKHSKKSKKSLSITTPHQCV